MEGIGKVITTVLIKDFVDIGTKLHIIIIIIYIIKIKIFRRTSIV